LGVLGSLAQFPGQAPQDFVPNLLEIRTLMAPAYTRKAAARKEPEVINLLHGLREVEDQPLVFANADWQLHHQLSILSGNPIFTLILNGFENLYCSMARIYFSIEPSRAHSRRFYLALLEAVQLPDLEQVERLTQETMVESLGFWEMAIRQADVDDVNNGWRE
jgi:GntR family negative regulator for fad regulon and positive regulator of fabA